MKKSVFYLVMFALAGVVFLGSCNKDDDNDDDQNIVPPTNTTELSAKLDGVQFTASLPITGLLDTDDNLIGIIGDNANGTLMVTLSGDISVGSHTATTGTTENISWDPDGGFTFFSKPVTIVISKHDVVNRRIEATFSGTLEGTSPPAINLTDGVLKINYQVI